MSTNALKAKDIKRDWHLFDAKDKVLGRLSTQIATVLMGKNKADFVSYLDNGDFVVVVNASKIILTGKKENSKTYFRHSGYPGGDKVETIASKRVRKPTEIIRHSVVGMLPKNKLGKKMINKLHIFADAGHPFQDRLTKEADVGKQ